MSSQVKRGVFINTAKKVCSIHESGLMVYSSIAQGTGYEIDYFSMDMLDVGALEDRGAVELRNPSQAGVRLPLERYDFWVFNWHFYTMAMDVEPAVIAALAGPKFTVVLELAPGDPLQLVPSGVFDGYIALDPGAAATRSIYPFPRPLDHEPRSANVLTRKVPVIGSFGFATPGKGFETIVEAANLEFDRAIVRINIPRGDFIGTDFLHGRDYAEHLEDLCRRIAKPGIDVRFSRDLMSSEELIDWCGDNDLNCFFYTRCQPGLSATTDQAIISGRPLLTSSNDTFRHIHNYIDPYPLMTLKAAIETTRPMVERLQQDWSKDAFNARFARMLCDFGILEALAVPAQAVTLEGRPARTVLLAAGRTLADGIANRAQRIANALGRSGEYVVPCVHCGEPLEIVAAASKTGADAVIVTDMSAYDKGQIVTALAGFDGPTLLLGDATAGGEGLARQSGRFLDVPGIPVVPYFTLGQGPDADPTLWLVGFTADLRELDKVLRRVVRELPGVCVRIQLLPGASDADVRTLKSLLDDIPRVWAEVHKPARDGDAAVKAFASAKLIIVKNVDGHSDFLQNQAELAMITERAVVFSRAAPFAPFADKAICFEDRHLGELAALDNAAQIAVMQQFSEGAAFARLHAALLSAFGGRAIALQAPPAVTQEMRAEQHADDGLPEVAEILMSESTSKQEPVQQEVDGAREDAIIFIERTFQRYLGRMPDQAGLQHYLGLLDKGVPRRKIVRNVKRSQEARLRRNVRSGVLVVDGPTSSVKDLLALNGPAFVTKAYRIILERSVDPEGLAHHVNLLRAGQSKQSILMGLYRSPERGQIEPNLDGLDQFIRSYRRSRSIPWRWFNFNWRPRRLNQLLGIVEHRLAMLEAQLVDERTRHQSVFGKMKEQVLHLESAVALAQMRAEVGLGGATGPYLGGQPLLLTHARHRPGTLHVLVGQAGGRASAPGRYLEALVRTLLAQGQVIRLVEWDRTTKRILFAARETLQNGPWAGLDGLIAEQHPPRGTANLALAPDSVDPADWLLIGEPFRTPKDPAILMEVDLVIEARRLGLENAFVFHGAGALGGGASSRASVACHEQYMQALLLADGVVAASEQALDELEHYLSVSQLADRTAPRAVVNVPSGDSEAAWRAYGQELVAQLALLRSDAPYIGCDVLAGDGSDASFFALEGLEAGLRRLGVDVRSGSLANIMRERPGLAKTDAAFVPTEWLICPGIADLQALEAVIDASNGGGRRLAILLDAKSLPEGVDASQALVRLLSKAAKIVCESEPVSEWLWRTLLSVRDRMPSCEERIVVLRPPSWDDRSEVDGYARRFARLLAEDLPAKRAMALPPKDAAKAKAMMPQLAKRPKLSLCISTYNRAKWLDRSLGNIFSQIAVERDDLEIMVIDNCSTDETPRIGEKYRARRDFTFIRNPVNVGMLGNLAVTAQRARGEYIWILGDDDLTRSGAIERILGLLNKNSDLELVYMNYGYTSESSPETIEDLQAFLDGFNVLQPACPDEFSNVAAIAAKTENFYTAIYSHVYRRDHAMRSYCQDTSGRTFATMRACIPSTNYVLRYMTDAPAYWLGEQQIVVNSNVSWAAYGAMLELEHLPASWDLAERAGCPVGEVDMRRANRLWLVEQMWRDLFENDVVGNAAYISPRRSIMRLRHLSKFEELVPEFRRIYTNAHVDGNPAASLDPAVLFGAF